MTTRTALAAKRNRDSSFLFDLSHSFVYNVSLKEVVYYEKRLQNRGLLPRNLICRDTDGIRDIRTVHLWVKIAHARHDIFHEKQSGAASQATEILLSFLKQFMI